MATACTPSRKAATRLKTRQRTSIQGVLAAGGGVDWHKKPGRKTATTLKARQESGHCVQTKQESSHHSQNQTAKLHNSGGWPLEEGSISLVGKHRAGEV